MYLFSKIPQFPNSQIPRFPNSSILRFPDSHILCFFLLLTSYLSFAQSFSHADTLRGGLRPERTSFDVKHYNLSVKVDITNKSISGSNEISFGVVEKTKKIQIDLFANMIVDKISMKGKSLSFKRDGNAIFIQFPNELTKGSNEKILIEYHGQPRAAVRPPWDGGFSWTKDPEGNPWVTVSCEGLGASVWWPCKDHPADEPESADIHVEVPSELTAVSNGNLISKVAKGSTTQWNWHVSYPINTYNISLNIAKYAHWSEQLTQLNGKTLNLDYYVLEKNLDKARAHFQQSREMLLIFEKYFGPYPFPKDGYCLVETDYWGMEHQSAVAYGNHYKNNPFGFDFIIIHESAHEWFGNSISCSDHADLWIHEATGTYAEAVYLEEKMGKDMTQKYLNGQKERIKGKYPIVGPYGVNYQSPDSDMYFKGTWMFHTIRSIVNDDALWFKTLKDFCLDFYHKNTSTEEVVRYFDNKLNKNIKPLMDFYLFKTEYPTLEYKYSGGILTYRWKNLPDNIHMPVDLLKGKSDKIRLTPTQNWQDLKIENGFQFDTEHFLMNVEKLN